VGNQSLIISSILSKKMAEGLDALVLDVKVGRGAIFPDVSSARHLAEGLVSTARGVGLRTTAVLTAMDQPLGFYVGNSLEVRQALEVLQGDENAKDYVECLLTLGGVMLQLGRCVKLVEQGMALMHARIKDRSGLKIFRRLVKAQGGDVRVVDEPDRLVERRQTHNIRSAHGGFLSVLDARRVGRAAVLTGAGRENKDQPIDPHAGIILRKKVGDPVGTGEVLATLYASDRQRLKSAEQEFLSGVQVNKTRPRRAPTVISILRGV
jgi:thymidine phosphorylase